MKALNGIITAAAALSFAACAPSGGLDGSGPHPRKGPEATTVQVQNNNWSDMVVYLVQGSSRTRLGMVTSMGSETFRIPRSALGATGQVRLFADPIGSRVGYMTDPLNVRAGQRVALEV